MSVIRIENIDLSRKDYDGKSKTTLCKGCGHNSISSQIVKVAYEMKLNPHYIIKLSGIGCSSKSPAYFLGTSHGFNSLHGRMPAIGTGATTVNRQLLAIGVSGDGDSGSIGMGQFKHAMRRNIPMVYIIENNGVYGLTKGQFSALADYEQKSKYADGGVANPLKPIDLCIEALVSGATFVARSFAGDAGQVRELLKAAISHDGIALLDIISPCVTFNNRDDVTKSYGYGKEHAESIQDINYIPTFDEIVIDDQQPGEERWIELHDGSAIRVKKLDPADHDPTDRSAALNLLEKAYGEDKYLTGLFYIDPNRPAFPALNNLVEEPLVSLPEEKLRPSEAVLDGLMDKLIYG